MGRMQGQGLNRRAVLRAGALAGFAALMPASVAQALSISTDPTAHLRAFAKRWVGAGKLPGLVIALGLPGRETQYIAQGSEGFIDSDAMGPDTLFRIYSMTKPVTGMATMMLIDDGLLNLDQPLAEILPQFAKMQVQVTPDGSITDLRPAENSITIRHLLTHTSGLAYGIIQTGPIRDALIAKGLVPGQITRLPIPSLSRGDQVKGLAAFCDGMAQMPLVYEPGTRWSYGPGLDVLGRVIEVATGKPFETFLQERLFTPLGMASTGFQVSKSDIHRFATNYGVLGGRLVPIDTPEQSVFLDKPPFPFGGAGLISTPRDYDRFLQMIGNRGIYEGKQVMSERAVRLATSNLLPPKVPTGNIMGMNLSAFGAGGRVGTGPEAGIFGWSGAAGTVGMVDMNSGLTSSLYVQFMPPDTLGVLAEFQTALKADVTTLLEDRR